VGVLLSAAGVSLWAADASLWAADVSLSAAGVSLWAVGVSLSAVGVSLWAVGVSLSAADASLWAAGGCWLVGQACCSGAVLVKRLQLQRLCPASARSHTPTSRIRPGFDAIDNLPAQHLWRARCWAQRPLRCPMGSSARKRQATM
jgi:hypothetical protein